MTWDTESTDPQKQDKSIKIYRPLGTPSTALGHQILVLATKADGTVDADRTIVKKSSDKPTTLQATGNTKNIIDAME